MSVGYVMTDTLISWLAADHQEKKVQERKRERKEEKETIKRG